MTSLAWRRTGPHSDLPFVLLHAMPLDGSMWDSVRSELAEIDVLTVDAPGFGGSPSGVELQGEYGIASASVEVFVRALKDTLDSIGITRIVLGGLSMGGSVAAAFTLAYPGMVAGLALMDTNIGADVPAHREIRLNALRLCAEGRPYDAVKDWTTVMVSPSCPQEIRDSLDARFRQISASSLAWVQEALMNRADARDAVRIDGPVLLERGSDDATCSRESFAELQERAPHARIAEIPGAGHFTADEKPTELAALLRGLYQEASATQA